MMSKVKAAKASGSERLKIPKNDVAGAEAICEAPQSKQFVAASRSISSVPAVTSGSTGSGPTALVIRDNLVERPLRVCDAPKRTPRSGTMPTSRDPIRTRRELASPRAKLATSAAAGFKPVRLAFGLPSSLTKPTWIASDPIANTIGIVEVAALAASAGVDGPIAIIYRHLPSKEIRRQFWQSLVPTARVPVFDGHVLPLDPVPVKADWE
jgi:hypothetical protein